MSALIDRLASEAQLPEDDFSDIRRHARQKLMQHGFPDLKTEDWKYTPLRTLEKRELNEQLRGTSDAPDLPFDCVVIHFDHGRLDPALCRLPEGVRLEPIGRESLEHADYGGRAGAFAWLNLARFEQGWRLVIESDRSEPLVLAFTASDSFDAASHPRIEIELKAGVSATVVEYHDDAGAGLVNIVEDIFLRPGSRLDHVVRRAGADSVWVQRTEARIEADADYRFHALDFGGRLVRQDLRVYLTEAGATGEIDGVATIDSRQHVDYHTAIDHVVGGTNSRESFRILADGTGVGVFNGRIHIHPGADDSHSDLNTGNMLLSETARINTKPELEIHAEEVTASHGATVGQIDSDAVFYLRSRGLTSEEAMALLKYGFAAAPLNAMENETLREWMLEELSQAL